MRQVPWVGLAESILSRGLASLRISEGDAVEVGLRQSMLALVVSSRKATTLRSYLGPIRKFEQWCASRAPARCSLPACPTTVALYLVSEHERCVANHLTYAVIKRASAAIFTMHELFCYDPPTKHVLPKLVRAGSKRVLGQAVLNRKEPFTADMMVAVAELYAGPGSAAARVMLVALLVLCFAGGFRFSDVADVLVQDVSFHAATASVPEHMRVYVRERKNDQYRESDTVPIIVGQSAACPVRLVQRVIQQGNLARGDFLFRGFTGARAEATAYKACKFLEPPERLAYDQARSHCLRLLAKVCGVPFAECSKVYGMHSGRSGAATAAVPHGFGGQRDLLCCQMGWRDPRSAARYVKEDVAARLRISASVGL